MGVENFYQGEEVSARKLNELVCAINNLCSTMQALQREQTVSGLGQNDRPRMLGRPRECDGENPCYTGRKYYICAHYDTVEAYVPPWGVVGVRRREWDEETCQYVMKRYYYVQSGVWKEGQSHPAGIWCSEGEEYTDTSDGLEGSWRGPNWIGGWIAESCSPGFNYLFATNCGKLVLKNSMVYDWRYERLLADLGSWAGANGNTTTTIARNGCTEEIFFPVQYWTGDICQPKARWEQGGMFSVTMNPRTGRVHICGGLAMVEGPLAVGGDKTFDFETQTTHEEINDLQGSGAYYQTPGFDSNIPAAVTGRAQYLYLGFDAGAEVCGFFWFWKTDTVSYAKEDIPIFIWKISSTSEVYYCGTYVICTTWGSKHCNYMTWRMALPVGVAYSGECGYVCIATAQYVPQFRARPIVNLQEAGKICSTGNDWACEGYRTPCGCQPAWVVGGQCVCERYGEMNGLYLDVVRGIYVKWTKCNKTTPEEPD